MKDEVLDLICDLCDLSNYQQSYLEVVHLQVRVVYASTLTWFIVLHLYICVFVIVYLCICIFVYLCICVSVYLYFCICKTCLCVVYGSTLTWVISLPNKKRKESRISTRYTRCTVRGHKSTRGVGRPQVAHTAILRHTTSRNCVTPTPPTQWGAVECTRYGITVPAKQPHWRIVRSGVGGESDSGANRVAPKSGKHWCNVTSSQI